MCSSDLRKARLVVDREGDNDSMVLRCEIEGPGGDNLAAAIAQSIQAVTKLRGSVIFAALGSLPNDGKVIEDLRKTP